MSSQHPKATFHEVVAATKALADPTRVRIVAILARHELTVSELCAVLDQSQPRVSRHLRLLVDAALAERNAQGVNAFYRLADGTLASNLGPVILDLLTDEDPVLGRDRRRLTEVLRAREEEANAYFEQVAQEWDELRQLHVHDELVEAAVREAVPTGRARRLLDLGTGTGRMLEVLADRVESGVGVDLSRQMLQLARSRLEDRGLFHLRVKHGSIFDLDIEPESCDVATIHHVLHFLDDPGSAIRQAGEALELGGCLLIVDFGPHQLEKLRLEHAHRRLGIEPTELARWLAEAGLETDLHRSFSPDVAGNQSLTVELWRARKISRPTELGSQELAS